MPDMPLTASGVLSLRQNSIMQGPRRFDLSRSADIAALTAVRDQALAHKASLIQQVGVRSGSIAGYDPAGAGSPWYSIGARNVNGRVKALAVHPTNPDIVYAGAASGGVWKSIDGGQTWDALWDKQQSLAIGALGIARGAPDTVYAGTGEWTPGFGPSYGGAGVFVTTDGGISWSQRSAVKSRYIGKLVVDPYNPKRLWICGDKGLERSTNGGVTWTTLKTCTITDIALDPSDANTMFIAVKDDGFYRSTDSGSTFCILAGAPSGGGLKWPQLAIGESGAHGHNFIVIKDGDRVQQSTDGGATFAPVSGTHGHSFAGWCDVIACAPNDEEVLFWGGVWLDRTGNGGTSWTTWKSPYMHPDQHAVVFAPSNSNIVYVANDGGVYRSDDKGVTFRKVSNGLVITQFYNINFWSTLSNVIGGGAQDNRTNWTTGSLTWQPTYQFDGGWFVIDPNDPRTMYAESQHAADIAKSTDGGQTWQSKSGGIVGTSPTEAVLTLDPHNHLRLFYGTDRVLRNNDALTTDWTQSSQVLAGEVTAIAVAPSNSNRVYAGSSSGKLYRSDDGGNSQPWADQSGTLPGKPLTSIVVDYANADIVLVTSGGVSKAESAQAVYRTTDGGAKWIDVSGDLPRVVANSIAIDPSSANTWYLATDTGIYRSINGGTHWIPFDNGIPNVVVSDLVVDAARKILYCATMGRGAYKLDIAPGARKRHVDIFVRDSDLDTGELFPSPSNLPDPLLPSGNAWWWMSPDVKVNHAPFYAPTGVFDGVMFDSLLIHQDPWRGQSNRFYVQVTNRGWKPTSNVSVRAFIADASAGLPALPNALVPPAFHLTSTTHWTPIGASQTIAKLLPNRPAVVHWDFVVPTSAATHICCLVVTSSPDDPLNDLSTDVAHLVTMNKRVALHNLHVIDPGPGVLRQTMLGINFHNAVAAASLIDIAMYPHGFERGAISLLLPPAQPQALQDVEALQLPAGANLGSWYMPAMSELPAAERSRLIAELTDCFAARLHAVDLTRAYRFNPARMSRIRGVAIPAGGMLQGTLILSHERDVPLPAPPRIELVQIQGEHIVGGSTFVVGQLLPTVRDPLSSPSFEALGAE